MKKMLFTIFAPLLLFVISCSNNENILFKQIKSISYSNFKTTDSLMRTEDFLNVTISYHKESMKLINDFMQEYPDSKYIRFVDSLNAIFQSNLKGFEAANKYYKFNNFDSFNNLKEVWFGMTNFEESMKGNNLNYHLLNIIADKYEKDIRRILDRNIVINNEFTRELKNDLNNFEPRLNALVSKDNNLSEVENLGTYQDLIIKPAGIGFEFSRIYKFKIKSSKTLKILGNALNTLSFGVSKAIIPDDSNTYYEISGYAEIDGTKSNNIITNFKSLKIINR